MKVGDQIVVTLQGYEVALATVEQIENDEAVLIIPATRIVMGVKNELTDLEREPAVDRQFGVIQEGTGESPAKEEVDGTTITATTQTPAQRAGIPMGESIHEGAVLDSSALDD